jgi:hypothetical protein
MLFSGVGASYNGKSLEIEVVRQEAGMEQLVNSMVRFSAAFTVFGVRQLQNAVSSPMESLKGIEQLRLALDSMTHVLTRQARAPLPPPASIPEAPTVEITPAPATAPATAIEKVAEVAIVAAVEKETEAVVEVVEATKAVPSEHPARRRGKNRAGAKKS